LNYRLIAAIATLTCLSGIAGCSRSSQKDEADSAKAAALSVHVVTPQRLVWPQTIQGSGQLAAWQDVLVTTEVGGLQLVELNVEVGARVRRGQLLAKLADESVRHEERRQQAAVSQAKANLAQAQSNLRRAEQVEGSGALSAQRIDEYRIAAQTASATLASAEAELDSARLKVRQTRIVAPDDGIVYSKTAAIGSVNNAGTELFRLVRQGVVEWRAELDARQLASVQPGRPAQVTLPTGQTVKGEVRLVDPTLSPSTGRAIAHVRLPIGSPARPGMFGNGVVELDHKPALTVPATAVVMRDGRAYVYLVDAQSVVTGQLVSTGRRRDGMVEILEGLQPTARLVASGGAFLSEGTRVQVLSAAATSASGAASGSAR
jgi:RND family efflux transporter MFP subunit